jgi:hypothetical protein
MNHSRYLHLKARLNAENNERALAAVWKGKYLANPGSNALPQDFPAYEILTTAPVPYLTFESLEDVTVDELAKIGIRRKVAESIMEQSSFIVFEDAGLMNYEDPPAIMQAG